MRAGRGECHAITPLRWMRWEYTSYPRARRKPRKKLTNFSIQFPMRKASGAADGGIVCEPGCFSSWCECYLRSFQYGNATRRRLLDRHAAVSGRPVDKIMPTFVEQAGEPLMTVKATCAAAPPEPKVRSRRRRRTRRIALLSQRRKYRWRRRVSGWILPVPRRTPAHGWCLCALRRAVPGLFARS